MQDQKLKDLDGAEKIIESLREIGIDAKDFKRDQLTQEMINTSDKIIVMAEEETIPDYLKESTKVIYWDIEDPKNMSQAETNEIRDQIIPKVKNLIECFK